MAEFKSRYKTALDAAAVARNGNASWNDRESGRNVIRDAVTIVNTEAATDYVNLGPVGLPCEIVPESSRIRYAGVIGATLSVSVKLQKVFAAAEPVDATWSRSGTTVTVTTLAKHGYQVGQVLTATAVAMLTGSTTIATGSYTISAVTNDYVYTFTSAETGTATGTITIGPEAGAVQDITAALAIDGTGVETFAPATSTTYNGLVSLKAADSLRLYFTAVTTVTAGKVLLLEIDTLRRTS